MKEKTRYFATVLILCAAFGWWGILYPQLTMTRDTYSVVSENGAVQEEPDMVEWDFEGSVYREILEAGPEKIRFRSGILKYITEHLEFWKKERVHE